jgi:hypothetical protein
MAHPAHRMTHEQHVALAEQLRSAERAGDLSGAYCLLRVGTVADAAMIAVRAGHSITNTGDRGFWQHLQSQVAQACRQLCDGFELRQRLLR